MMNPAAILARRSATAGILISDEVVAARLAWPRLQSLDGHDVRVEWTLRVACVDTPADRQLLVEHFAANPDVTVAAVAEHLERSLAPRVARIVEVETVEALLSGRLDPSIGTLLEDGVRREAFAMGLSILPPFALRLTSPSRERDRRVASLQARRDALVSAVAEGDTHALLRAAASAEPAWSAATPGLWVVAGTRLIEIDPTRPMLDATRAIELPDSLGPPRSVRGAAIDGVRILLVGARDGVYAIDTESRAVFRAFAHQTGGNFGFNAACFSPAGRRVVATHSRAGVVAWSWDAPERPATVAAAANARTVVPADTRFAAMIADGRLVTLADDGGLIDCRRVGASVAQIDGEHFACVADDGAVTLLTAADLSPGAEAISAHGGGPVVAAAGVDLAGLPRVLVAMAGGGLKLLDFAGGAAAAIGPGNLAVRSLATRPGFAAAVGIDRSRVFLIDLSKPEAVAAELHVAATCGSRVADAWFA